jgi:cysteine synthase
MSSSFAYLLRSSRLASASLAAGVPKRKAVSPATSSSWTILHVGRRDLHVASRPSDLIGGTPLLDLGKILEQAGVANGSRLYGKLESLGPCSSVKDRLGRSMIDQAERDGKIKPGETVLVEPTSGNTGIALAFIARERGYRCILTMPETMSVERRMMLLALGCEVVLTPKETAVPGALAKAHEILGQLDGKGYMLQQFENPANPKVHRETVRFPCRETGSKDICGKPLSSSLIVFRAQTGPEIWRDTDGSVDIFVSGVGTGGTVRGQWKLCLNAANTS